jgi:hypothetical protein
MEEQIADASPTRTNFISILGSMPLIRKTPTTEIIKKIHFHLFIFSESKKVAKIAVKTGEVYWIDTAEAKGRFWIEMKYIQSAKTPVIPLTMSHLWLVPKK